MELKIISKEEKPLLSRTEAVGEMIFDKATPSKEEIKKKIAETLKSDPNVVVIKKVDTFFGQKQGKVLAFIYSNEKDMKKIEPKPKEKKGKKKEKKEEAPTAEKAKEKPEEKPKKEVKPKEEPKKEKVKKEEKPKEVKK